MDDRDAQPAEALAAAVLPAADLVAGAAPVSTVTEAAPATRSAAARTAASSTSAGCAPRSSIVGATAWEVLSLPA